MRSERFAIQLMVAQAALFAAETAAIHQIGGRLSVMQVGFLRSSAGVVLALLLARQIGFGLIHTRQLALQLMRGAVSLLYLWVMIYSFGSLPFADATAISFSQVAYIALFSALLLREHVTGRRWFAAALAIAGAVLIAKPSFGSWNSLYLIALLGAALNGLAFVLNRYLQQEDSQATTMFYTNIVAVVGNLPALFAGSPLPSEAWVWLPGVLVLGPLGMYAGIVAVRHANASALGPYTLLRLVIATAAGIIIFRELPDSFSLLGSVVILIGCMLAGVANVPAACRRMWRRRMTAAIPSVLTAGRDPGTATH
ncbi:MAG TPA: DMT family transporter [Xanthobacteraceae bacterium]|nr:DMT family transporter [Xanthobacteraceae bacterium]